MYIATFSVISQILLGPVLEILRPRLVKVKLGYGISLVGQLSLLCFGSTIVLLFVSSVWHNSFTFISGESNLSTRYLLPYMLYFLLTSLSGLSSALLNAMGKYILSDLLLSLLVIFQLIAVNYFHTIYSIDIILIWGINTGILFSLILTLFFIKSQISSLESSLKLNKNNFITSLSIFRGILPVYMIFGLTQIGFILEKRYLVGLGSGIFLLFHYPSQVKNILSGLYQSVVQSVFITERLSGTFANVPLLSFISIQSLLIFLVAMYMPTTLIDFFGLNEIENNINLILLFRMYLLLLIPVSAFILISNELLILNRSENYKTGGLINSVVIFVSFLFVQGDYIYAVPLVLICSHLVASVYMVLSLRRCRSENG